MSRTAARGKPDAAVDRILAIRAEAGEQFFEAEAERIARLCRLLAERFARGGRLLAVASTPQGWSDAHHVAVEFVHPVIVGKRALPALALSAADLDLLARGDDMVMTFDEPVPAPPGVLSIAFSKAGADWDFVPRGDDPFVHQEIAETAYHMLWELVHVFFDHLGGSSAGAGASGFLYPFLDEEGRDLTTVEEDVRASVSMKAAEIGDLRVRTVEGARAELTAAARALRERFATGGTLFAFGNGGSATDAMDLVADFRAAPQGWPSLRAVDLTADSAILTALANDIGSEVLFSRQLIAYAKPGVDAAIALSTSGNSANIMEALAEARRRNLLTVALVGYDGGRIAAERLADHVIVTPSEHIPRIQEAQATAYHTLRELVEAVP
ncbi:MAG: D-sedoheptulose 7-phosphate isomerase [Gaiellaceae bacterium]|jgi:D-sedoheptulose 7-phosphate isomerase|nr:D-sedoheptulose 7-phosphate isomerase [Gaiellaceae bacterium]